VVSALFELLGDSRLDLREIVKLEAFGMGGDASPYQDEHCHEGNFIQPQ
jgi:hypothetical protein